MAMSRHRSRRASSLHSAGQLSLFDIADVEKQAIVQHSRIADATTLLTRIMYAAQANPRIALDLRGDISQYATSWQALELLLVEHTIIQEINPVRLATGQDPIVLSYLLPEDPSVQALPGLADLAHLGLQYHLKGLTFAQKQLFEGWASHKQQLQNTIFAQEDEESPELGEITLLPIIPIEGSPGTVEPLVRQARQELKKLLQQGLPGINDAYVMQIVTFIEESASNIRDHASDGLQSCEGFVAANRTLRTYRDRIRSQLVSLYTTYVACFDFGRGILPALASVPAHGTTLYHYPEAERDIAALRLAIRPDITSKIDEAGRGGGLPRMVHMVRSIAEAGDNQTYAYRGVLRLVSCGGVLDICTTTETAHHDRLLPGTQLLLRFEAIQRISG
jgi:hypothetical protein